MKYPLAFLIVSILLAVSACQPPSPACPPESITYLKNSIPSASVLVPETTSPASVPEVVDINGEKMTVDKVVRGTLCSDAWRGTIYVPCQIQIFEWDEEPDFLENCDLTIDPGTVVYVAAHHDEPYYKGCSCHAGEESQ